MRDPIRLKLEYLASTYNIENLGLAWIEQKPDGSRTLVLCEVPEHVAVVDVAPGSSVYDSWYGDLDLGFEPELD